MPQPRTFWDVVEGAGFVALGVLLFLVIVLSSSCATTQAAKDPEPTCRRRVMLCSNDGQGITVCEEVEDDCAKLDSPFSGASEPDAPKTHSISAT